VKLILSSRSLALAALSILAVIAGGAGALLGDCGPFTDAAADGFCPFVLEIFTLGITTGTSPTTYDPTSSVSRLQMAAFLSRSVDGALKRGSRRAALGRFWTPQNANAVSLTPVDIAPLLLESDGVDTWAASAIGTVSHLRGTDGKLLETWTGATAAGGVLAAMGRVFVTGGTSPGSLYRIDPTQAPGAVTTVASNLGNIPFGIAFDGARVWTANGNLSPGGNVSIVTPGASIPWSVTTVTTGFSGPYGALFDGTNVWVTDESAGKLLKLDAGGAILQTVTVQSSPRLPVYDGTNIWVPNLGSNSVSVVRASSGVVLQTLTGNGLNSPVGTAFDGQQVLITNVNGGSVSLWKAADLTTLGTFPIGASSQPVGACSDGVNFWIALVAASQIARF
jgi:hypothetical protein